MSDVYDGLGNLIGRWDGSKYVPKAKSDEHPSEWVYSCEVDPKYVFGMCGGSEYMAFPEMNENENTGQNYEGIFDGITDSIIERAIEAAMEKFGVASAHIEKVKEIIDMVEITRIDGNKVLVVNVTDTIELRIKI